MVAHSTFVLGDTDGEKGRATGSFLSLGAVLCHVNGCTIRGGGRDFDGDGEWLKWARRSATNCHLELQFNPSTVVHSMLMIVPKCRCQREMVAVGAPLGDQLPLGPAL